eukprot:712220-Rhodomonas_salina.1
MRGGCGGMRRRGKRVDGWHGCGHALAALRTQRKRSPPHSLRTVCTEVDAARSWFHTDLECDVRWLTVRGLLGAPGYDGREG